MKFKTLLQRLRKGRRTGDVSWVKCGNPRSLTTRAAWILAGKPQKKLQMLAVTGINGKSGIPFSDLDVARTEVRRVRCA